MVANMLTTAIRLFLTTYSTTNVRVPAVGRQPIRTEYILHRSRYPIFHWDAASQQHCGPDRQPSVPR